MICVATGTLTLIVRWLDIAFTQISRAEAMATRFEAAGVLVGETMNPIQIASILEAEVARLRSLLET